MNSLVDSGMNRSQPLQWSEISLVLGLASTLVMWGGQTYWPLAFSLLGLYTSRKAMWRFLREFDSDSQMAIRVMVGSFVVYCVSRMAFYLAHGNRFNMEPLIPFLLFPFLVPFVVQYGLRQRAMWLGIMLGSMLTTGLATYQVFVLGLERACGFANPITFGDVCVLFALSATIGATGSYARNHEAKWFRYTLFVAAALAGYASLLSGSKGGWLSLLVVAALGAARFWRNLPRTTRPRGLLLVLAFVFAAGVLVPQRAVQRVESGVKAGVHWLQTGEVTDGSVSYRFEMWAFGLTLFKEYPVMGASRAQWLEKRSEYVQQGRFSPKLLELQTTDSQFIGDLAEGGLWGLTQTLMLIFAPVWAFRRLHSRYPNHTRIQDLSVLGMWIPIVFAEFGLSVSLWGLSMFRQVYVSWLALVLAMLLVEIQRVQMSER